MSLSVVRPDLIGNIVNGCGNHIKVVDEHRGRKHKVKIQTAAAEGVISARGHYSTAQLAGFLLLIPFRSDILGEAHICHGATLSVVAMEGNDVLALFKKRFLPLIKFHAYSHAIGRGRLRQQFPIGIDLHIIVERKHEIKVLPKVVLLETHNAANPDIGIIVFPEGAHPGIILTAKSTFSLLPTVGIEVDRGPVVIRFLAGVDRIITFLVTGRNNGLENFTRLRSHEAIVYPVYTQNPIQRLLIACPVLREPVIKMVERRPDRQVGVIHENRIRG